MSDEGTIHALTLAMLATLREPTEAMLTAGERAVGVPQDVLTAIWRAMVDAAAKELLHVETSTYTVLDAVTAPEGTRVGDLVLQRAYQPEQWR